jgi:ribokinase
MIYCFGLLGMSLIMPGTRLPAPGQMLLGDAYHLRPSMGAGSIAVAARRAGAPAVALCAVMGEDEFGTKLLTHLQTQKLDLQYTTQIGGMTALMHSAVVRGGVVQHALSLGVAVGIRAETLSPVLTAGDHLVADALANPPQSYALLRAAREAGAAGYLFYTHGAPVPPDDALQGLKWLLTDLAGASALSGQSFEDDAALAEWASAFGLKHQLHVAVMKTPFEILTFTFQGGLRWQGLRAESLDHTGAAEAWLGTLVTALAANLPEQRALARAAAAASLATLALGAQDAMVQNQTLADWLPDLPQPERLV